MNILHKEEPPKKPDGVERPLGEMENMMRICHKFGNTQIVYALMLHCKDALDSSLVCDALIHLRRKFPMLRMRLTEDEDECFYFQEMEEEELDFESMEQEDWMNEYEEMLRVHYDEQEGPLWQVKLLKLPVGSPQQREATKTNNDGESSEKAFKYVMLFGFHHVISDGYSSMMLFDKFLKILNFLIAGKDVSDEQETQIMPAIEDLVPEEERKFRIGDVLSTVKFFGKRVIFQRKNLFLNEYPAPRSTETGRTRTVPFELSEEETTTFVQRCKIEKATVHGAFTVAANKALYELIHRDKIERPRVTIRSEHKANLHRFCQPWRDMSKAFGMYVGSFDLDVDCSAIDMPSFWKTAEQTTAQIHNELTAQKVLQTKRIAEKILDPEKFLVDMTKTNKSDTEFTTSNLGDVSKLFSGLGEHVEVGKILQSTSAHLLGSSFTHNFVTFRGKFFYNLDYFTNFVTEEQAREYGELVMYNIRKAADVLHSHDGQEVKIATPSVKVTPPPDVVIDVEQATPLLNGE